MTWHALDVDGPIGTTPVAAQVVGVPSTQVLVLRTTDGTCSGPAGPLADDPAPR